VRAAAADRGQKILKPRALPSYGKLPQAPHPR
jgi:hypothetical protein